MSDIAPAEVSCPRCGQAQRATLWTSLDVDAVAAQREALREGCFEACSCAGCGLEFRPEHRLLVTLPADRIFLVMVPPAERASFAALEVLVEQVVARELAAAPPIAAERLRGVRPRLVFGQHGLTEAVRIIEAGLDPALLECAKLMAIRAALGGLLPYGPFELTFVEQGADGRLRLLVRRLADAAVVDELMLPAAALEEVAAARAELADRFPELFERPYVAACRYLQPGSAASAAGG